MLHKLTSTYQDIAKYFPELVGKISSSAHKKNLLLEMAREGKQKPKQNTKLGCVLYSYISNKSSSHDPEFTKEIKRLRPDWLLSKVEKANHKKSLLLTMAKKGEPKPLLKKHPLASVLGEYTRKRKYRNTTYDPIFTKQIKKLRPDWFVSRTEIANQKKKLLLDMAKKGDPRPTQKTPLGGLLCGYTVKSSTCYDPIFTKQIKKLRPDWFVSRTELSNQTKKSLLAKAKKGDCRPDRNSPLGNALNNCYLRDPDFINQIKKLRPDWFVSRTEIANQKKKLLLDMAKKGEPRPRQKTPLGKALSCYTTNKKCFDPIFTKQIKKLAPHWFHKRRKK